MHQLRPPKHVFGEERVAGVSREMMTRLANLRFVKYASILRQQTLL